MKNIEVKHGNNKYRLDVDAALKSGCLVETDRKFNVMLTKMRSLY